MKINVIGRGIIPGFNCLAPIYNKEASEKLIRRLLNFHAFRLYDAKSGKIITKTNVQSVLDANKNIVEVQEMHNPVVPNNATENNANVIEEVMDINETTSENETNTVETTNDVPEMLDGSTDIVDQDILTENQENENKDEVINVNHTLDDDNNTNPYLIGIDLASSGDGDNTTLLDDNNMIETDNDTETVEKPQTSNRKKRKRH